MEQVVSAVIPTPATKTLRAGTDRQLNTKATPNKTIYACLPKSINESVELIDMVIERAQLATSRTRSISHTDSVRDIFLGSAAKPPMIDKSIRMRIGIPICEIGSVPTAMAMGKRSVK
jgi:hypothetical protein